MKYLPERPNLLFLLREAKKLKSAHRNGDKSICATIGHFDTSLHGLSDQAILDTRFSILDAQRVIARQHGFSSWSRLNKYIQRCEAGLNPSDISLKEQILTRYKEIRSLQKQITSLAELRSSKKEDKSFQDQYRRKINQYRQINLDSITFMSSAYDLHGWPGPEVIGHDCIEALTAVSCNAVYDAEFQYRSVQLLGEVLPEGGFNAYWYAQMLDRNLALSKQPTIYGTAFGSYYDVNGDFRLYETSSVDPENLDRRRATVGHDAMEETRQWCAREAKDNGWNIGTREQCVCELEKLHIEGGYQRQ